MYVNDHLIDNPFIIYVYENFNRFEQTSKVLTEV